MHHELPEHYVCHRMTEAGLTLSTAESCSGGLIASRLTDVPGASAFFVGGVVTYANLAKRELLGVPQEMLDTHGAVSEPVAKAMAEAVRERFHSDYALSCTGIAGPGGGTPEKPVGLVYIALARSGAPTVVVRNVFSGDRASVRKQTADQALFILMECLP